ncbi:MAG: hypothetical protein IT374_00515 [Polyangiaceae bacterium]|nr:hypothetical protein [Polyangiaceae bacterium]
MSDCHHVTLARSGIAHVQGCTGCGCVSVHLGPTTIRIDPAGLDSLLAVLGEASAAIHAERRAAFLDAHKGLA